MPFIWYSAIFWSDSVKKLSVLQKLLVMQEQRELILCNSITAMEIHISAVKVLQRIFIKQWLKQKRPLWVYIWVLSPIFLKQTESNKSNVNS